MASMPPGSSRCGRWSRGPTCIASERPSGCRWLPPWSPGRSEGPHFTFRFADDRKILRFHLEDVEAGRRVMIYKTDPLTGERLAFLAMATEGEGGWVYPTEPTAVRAGVAFIAVPEKEEWPE